MLDISVLRAMAAAGATVEMILAAVEASQLAEQAKVDERRAAAAARKRKSRSTPSHDVTQCHTTSRDVTVTECDTPPPLDGPPPPSPGPLPPPPLNPPLPIFRAVAEATRPAIDELFEQFWKNYPKRDGANPKQPAKKRFVSALKSGAVVEEIQQGARRYKAECDDKKITGTPMVAQAMTWLNQQRWTDYAPIAVAAKARDGPTPEQLARRRRMIEDGEKLLNGQDVQNQGPEDSRVVRDGGGSRPPA
jgi:hypothetical protein